MSSRIMRSPVARTTTEPGAKDAKKADKSSAKSSPQQTKAGFESHTGRDALLGEKAKGKPSLSRDASTGAKTSGGQGKTDVKDLLLGGGAKKGEGKGQTKGKGGVPAKGKQATKGSLGAKGKEKAKALLEGKMSSKGKAEAKGKSEGKVSAEGTKGKGEAAAKKASLAKATTEKSAAKQATVQSQISQSAQAKGKGAASSPQGQAAKGATSGLAQQAAAPSAGQGKQASGAPMAKEASTAMKGTQTEGTKGTTPTTQSSSAQKAQGSAPKGSVGGGMAQTAAQGSQAASGARGAAGAYSAKGSLGANKPGMQQQVGSSLTASKPSAPRKSSSLSLQSLQIRTAKEAKANAKSQETPRQRMIALVKQWTSAAEMEVLMQSHGVMPTDAAFVAKRIAVLAQSGQIPMSDLFTTLVKVLKKAGNRKKLQKLKDALVKKGVISAGISTETMELIAAMIALYLAKGGDANAEDLVVELFGQSSKRLELPDEGGGHHEEGREEERHQSHQKGDTQGDGDAGLSV